MRNSYTPHINYKFMDGAISPKQGYILPSDLDGILETNRKFLVFEWKRPGEELSKGQHIMLSRLAELPQFTVVVVSGHSDSYSTEVKEIYKMEKDGSLKEVGFGVDVLVEKTKKWFAVSCGKPYKHYAE
jgi:hypothetical protein